MPTDKYAIIDTESSGLFDFSKPADADGQPRMASLAIITFEVKPDPFGPDEIILFAEEDFLIAPDGWEMHPDATAVNGYTTEFLQANGKPVRLALDRYAALIDAGYIVGAYSAQFDTKIMRGEMRRAGIPDRFEQTPNICLMRACTNVVRVPKKTGSGFKFPKLSEACAFFKIEQPAAHSALGDTRSAVEIFRHLLKANLLPKPEVHFAKVQPSEPAK